MIANARALDTEWVPTEVVHRNAEKNLLRQALKPLSDGAGEAQHVVATGPPGAGKTCLTRYTVGRLEERVLGIDTAYVDCWVDTNFYQVCYKLLSAIGRAGTVHRGTPHDELLRHIREYDGQLVVILDEADSLENPELIRRLYGINGLTPLFIGSDMDGVIGRLDTHVRSRLRSGTTIRFDKYDVDTLSDILSERAAAGLEPEAIEDDQLRNIADAAVGNARDAIGALREAANIAIAEGSDTIDDCHIEQAIPEARAQHRQRDLANIGDNHRLVYEILRESEGLAPKTIHERFCERADETKTKRTVRKYLAKLEHYNLAWAAGEGPARRYFAQSFDS